MRVQRAQIALAISLTLGLALGSLPSVQAAKHASVQFAPLNVAAPNVLVTAMAIQPNGIIYAGGRYMTPNSDPAADQPTSPTGSVIMVSHNHGASWSIRVSTTSLHYTVTPWRDRALWPVDFTANSITVDPTNPRVIYVSGCTGDDECVMASGDHTLLRSSNGGATWYDALVYHQTSPGTVTAKNIVTNIAKTPALLAALQFGGTAPGDAFSVAVDPHNGRRVYACVSGLGMLRSDNGSRAWTYVMQPRRGYTPCEVLINPHNPRIVYSLDRQGQLYRSVDAGGHWALESSLGFHPTGSLAGKNLMTGLTLMGSSLFTTVVQGLYVSDDGGAHWKLVLPPPLAGGELVQAIRGSSGWLGAFVSAHKGPPSGLYLALDGAHGWQKAAYTDDRGPKYFGAMDYSAMIALHMRLWEDHVAHVVFTAGRLGGLYRWSSAV